MWTQNYQNNSLTLSSSHFNWQFWSNSQNYQNLFSDEVHLDNQGLKFTVPEESHVKVVKTISAAAQNRDFAKKCLKSQTKMINNLVMEFFSMKSWEEVMEVVSLKNHLVYSYETLIIITRSNKFDLGSWHKGDDGHF